MNSLPMILRFCSGSVTPASCVEEALAGVDGDDVEAELLAHGLLDLGELVFAEDAVVDEDAGEAVADGAGDEHGGDGGVDAAGEAADGVAVADLGADALDGGLDEVLGRPVGLGAADVEDEVAEEFHALAGVGDLGVELHGPDAARLRWRCRRGRWRSCAVRTKPSGSVFGFVAVAHPDFERAGQAAEERRLGDDLDLGVAVLARGCGLDLAAEVVGDELQAVADAEDGDAEREERGVGGGRVGVVDRAGPPERMRPSGLRARIWSSGAVQGSTTEKTLNSRMRRAMSWVYCDPKSRMTIVEVSTEPIVNVIGSWTTDGASSGLCRGWSARR